MIEGVDPAPGRLIAFVNPEDGKVYLMSIIEFIILQTANALERRGDESTPEAVSKYSGPMAAALSNDGWFSPAEYVSVWAENEASSIDDELKDLTGGSDG